MTRLVIVVWLCRVSNLPAHYYHGAYEQGRPFLFSAGTLWVACGSGGAPMPLEEGGRPRPGGRRARPAQEVTNDLPHGREVGMKESVCIKRTFNQPTMMAAFTHYTHPYTHTHYVIFFLMMSGDIVFLLFSVSIEGGVERWQVALIPYLLHYSRRYHSSFPGITTNMAIRAMTSVGGGGKTVSRVSASTGQTMSGGGARQPVAPGAQWGQAPSLPTSALVGRWAGGR